MEMALIREQIKKNFYFSYTIQNLITQRLRDLLKDSDSEEVIKEIPYSDKQSRYYALKDKKCYYLIRQDKNTRDLGDQDVFDTLLNLAPGNICFQVPYRPTPISKEEMLYATLNTEPTLRITKCTPSPYLFSRAVSCLGLQSKISAQDIISVTSQSAKESIQDLMPQVLTQTKHLYDICVKEKLFTHCAYYYNDLNNCVYFNKKENALTINSRDLIFAIKCDWGAKEVENMRIYMLGQTPDGRKSVDENEFFKFLSTDNLNDKIKDQDKIDTLLLNYQNSCVDFIDFEYAKLFFTHTLTPACSHMSKFFDSPVSYDVDIKSYSYQLAYCQHHFNFNEFDFISQCLTTLGSGATYDPQSMSYILTASYDPKVVKMMPELIKKSQSLLRPIKNISYCYNKIDTSLPLSAEWLQGAVKFSKILQEDQPQSNIFEKPTLKESLDSIVLSIKELEKNSKKQNKKIKP